MSKILLTHNDLDAAGCAVMFRSVWPDIRIIFCDRKTVEDTIRKVMNAHPNDEFIIADLSISVDFAKEISNYQVTLFDHHATALDLNQFDWCCIETHKGKIQTAAVELVYDWLVENSLMERNQNFYRFVSAVRDYDTGRWRTLRKAGRICRQLNDWFCICGKNNFVEWALTQLKNGVFPTFTETELLQINYRKNAIDQYVAIKNQQILKKMIDNKLCGVVFADSYFDDVGTRLCELNDDLDFVAVVNVGTGNISYRTIRENINLGQIAKSFGGGGHPQAAGSHFSTEMNVVFMNMLFNKNN